MDNDYIFLGKIETNLFCKRLRTIFLFFLILFFAFNLLSGIFQVQNTFLIKLSSLLSNLPKNFNYYTPGICFLILFALSREENVYLKIDENKNIRIILNIEKNITIDSFHYSEIENISHDVFLNTITINLKNENKYTIKLNVMENNEVAKLKLSFIQNYPDKIPLEWNNDKNVHQVLAGKKVAPSWLNVLKLTAIALGSIIILAIIFICIVLNR